MITNKNVFYINKYNVHVKFIKKQLEQCLKHYEKCKSWFWLMEPDVFKGFSSAVVGELSHKNLEAKKERDQL